MSSHRRHWYLRCFGFFLYVACFLSTLAHDMLTRIHVTCSALAFLNAVNGLRRPYRNVTSSESATSMCFAALAEAADQPRTVTQMASSASRLVKRRGMKTSVNQGQQGRNAGG